MKKSLIILVLKRIARDALKKRLFFNRKKILIAMSGGQDSITCLFFIFLIRNQLKLEIGSSNCNHLFQRDSFYCSLNNLNQLYAVNGKYYLSICPYWLYTEKKARDWRHSVLQWTASFHEFSCIYFGHTGTDRLETLLFQLLRGSGIQGIHSIQWKSNRVSRSFFLNRFSIFKVKKDLLRKKNICKHNINNICYCRPLLGITRLETCVICKGWSLPSYSDNSNHSLCYTRNKIRKNVLPILRRILNPRLEKTVCQFADILSEESLYINNVLEKIKIWTDSSALSRFARKDLQTAHQHAKAVILHRIVTSLMHSQGEDFQPFTSFGSIKSATKRYLSSKEVELRPLSFSKTLTLIRTIDLFPMTVLFMKPNLKRVTRTFFNDKSFLSKKLEIKRIKLISNHPKETRYIRIPLCFSNLILLDSLMILKHAPLPLKRRFLKNLLENFQIKEVNFQKIEMFQNSLFNYLFFQLKLFTGSTFQKKLISDLIDFNYSVDGLIFKPKNKRMIVSFSILFIPKVGILFLKRRKENLE